MIQTAPLANAAEAYGRMMRNEDEIGVAVALGVDVHPVADALVEVQFDHAAEPGFEQEETEGTEIFFSLSVSSVCSCSFSSGQCAGVFVGVGAAGIFVGDSLGGNGRV